MIRPWVPAPASPSVGALYFSVHNNGSSPDQLTGVSSPVSATASLHVDNPDGTMTAVRPLWIGAGATAALSPGHEHVMLEDLDRKLVRGQTVDVTLHFAHAGRIDLRVPILPTSAVATGMGGM